MGSPEAAKPIFAYTSKYSSKECEKQTSSLSLMNAALSRDCTTAASDVSSCNQRQLAGRWIAARVNNGANALSEFPANVCAAGVLGIPSTFCSHTFVTVHVLQAVTEVLHLRKQHEFIAVDDESDSGHVFSCIGDDDDSDSDMCHDRFTSHDTRDTNIGPLLDRDIDADDRGFRSVADPVVADSIRSDGVVIPRSDFHNARFRPAEMKDWCLLEIAVGAMLRPRNHRIVDADRVAIPAAADGCQTLHSIFMNCIL